MLQKAKAKPPKSGFDFMVVYLHIIFFAILSKGLQCFLQIYMEFQDNYFTVGIKHIGNVFSDNHVCLCENLDSLGIAFTKKLYWSSGKVIN